MFRKFLKSHGGNFAVTIALVAAPLFGSASLAFDYAHLVSAEKALQQAVDSAALATIKEMAVANADSFSLQSSATNYVKSNFGRNSDTNDTTVKVQITDDRSMLTVSVAHVWKPFLIHFFNDKALPIVKTATARLAGSGTICMLGLDEALEETIYLVKKAKLEAPGCGVYSNSSHKEAIKVEDDASLTTGVTCSSGGFKGAKKASFEPEPITDCPRVSDPLIDRPAPIIGSCDYNDFEINEGIHTLYPGTYCGGLKVKGTAEAFLKPGVYIIEGNKLEVTEGAKMQGENVGFYLSGDKSKLSFKKETTISLTAPKDGVLAGILVFEDRTASNELQKHEITSDDARILLGTIYLPNGTLKIDSEAPIADKSAYTAIIARTIELKEGPTLFLNSDYEATNVPVPEGLTNNEALLVK